MALKRILYEDIMSFITGSISSVVYITDDGAHTAEIRSINLVKENTVTVDIVIEKGNIKITEIQLYGKNGHLWAEVKTNITLDRSVAGVLYRFELSLKEVLPNV